MIRMSLKTYQDAFEQLYQRSPIPRQIHTVPSQLSVPAGFQSTQSTCSPTARLVNSKRLGRKAEIFNTLKRPDRRSSSSDYNQNSTLDESNVSEGHIDHVTSGHTTVAYQGMRLDPVEIDHIPHDRVGQENSRCGCGDKDCPQSRCGTDQDWQAEYGYSVDEDLNPRCAEYVNKVQSHANSEHPVGGISSEHCSKQFRIAPENSVYSSSLSGDLYNEDGVTGVVFNSLSNMENSSVRRVDTCLNKNGRIVWEVDGPLSISRSAVNPTTTSPKKKLVTSNSLQDSVDSSGEDQENIGPTPVKSIVPKIVTPAKILKALKNSASTGIGIEVTPSKQTRNDDLSCEDNIDDARSVSSNSHVDLIQDNSSSGRRVCVEQDGRGRETSTLLNGELNFRVNGPDKDMEGDSNNDTTVQQNENDSTQCGESFDANKNTIDTLLKDRSIQGVKKTTRKSGKKTTARKQKPKSTESTKKLTNQTRVESDPVPLYLWIMKPQPQYRGVCVEGKKCLSDEEFWHSGLVTERIDQNTVVTASGSSYRLMGNISAIDALAAGFSKETIDEFQRGFPVNWEAHIEDHFSQQNGRKERLGHSGFSNIEASLADDSQNESRPSAVSVGGDGDLSRASIDSSLGVQNHDEAQDSEEAGRATSGKTTADDINRQPKEYILTKWFIKPIAFSKEVCVEGTLREGALQGQFWHSTAIADRLDRKLLSTKSGSLYKLVGYIQKVESLEAGFPLKVVNSFRTGFPKEWREIIQEHFNPQTRVENGDQLMNTSKALTPPKVAKKCYTEVRTPTGDRVQLDNLPRTGSGRIIKPALAWWTGQRLEYDSKTNMVEIKYNSEYGKKYMTELSSTIGQKTQKVSAKKLSISKASGTKSVNTSQKSAARTPRTENERKSVESRNNVTAKKSGSKKTPDRSVSTSKNRAAKRPSSPKMEAKSSVKKMQINRKEQSAERKPLNKSVTKDKSSTSSQGSTVKKTVSPDVEKSVMSLVKNSKDQRQNKKHQRSTCYDQGDQPSTKHATVVVRDVLSDVPVVKKSGVQVLDHYSLEEDSDSDTGHEQREGEKKNIGNQKRLSNSSRVSNSRKKPRKYVDEEIVKQEFEANSPLSDIRQLRSRSAVQVNAHSLRSRNNSSISEIIISSSEDEDTPVPPSTKNQRKVVSSAKKNRSVSLNQNLSVSSRKQQRVESKQTEESKGTSSKVSNTGSKPGKRIEKIVKNHLKSDSQKQAQKGETRTKKTKQNAQEKQIDQSMSDFASDLESSKPSRRTSVSKNDQPLKNNAKSRKSGNVGTSPKGKKKMTASERNSLRAHAIQEGTVDEQDKRLMPRELRKVAHIDYKDNSTDDEALNMLTRTVKKKTTAKTASRGGSAPAKKKSVSMLQIDDEDAWDKQESERLFKMMQRIRTDDPRFWDLIAEGVQTRTVEECKQFYYKEIPEPGKKKKTAKSRASTGKEKGLLTAKVGTLKRKQQLREMLDQHNADYEDDIFDGTPFRKASQSKVPRLEDEEGDVFAELERNNPQGLDKFQTPNARFHMAPVSERKTPATSLISPWPTVDRKNADQYIQQVQLRRRRLVTSHGKKKAKVSTSQSSKKTSPNKSLFGTSAEGMDNLFHQEEHSSDNYRDSDDGNDYYWSDEMEDN